MKVRPHVFVPDVSAPEDYKGRRPCVRCPLPERNTEVHIDPPADDSARILGEGEEVD